MRRQTATRDPRTMLKSVRDWPVAAKLVGLMTLVALVPLAFVVVAADRTQRTELLNEQRREAQRNVQETAALIDQVIEQRKKSISALAASPLLGTFAASPSEGQGAQDVQLNLNNLRRTDFLIDSLFLASARGEVLANAGSVPSLDLGRSIFFRAATNGTTGVSDVERLGEDRRVVYYAAPVRDRRQSITGVLVMGVLDDDFGESIRADRGALGPGSYATLWQRGGLSILGGPSESHERQILQAEPEFARLLAEVREPAEFRAQGANGPELYAAYPLQNQPWVVTIQQPESSVLAGLNNQTRANLTIFLLAALAVVAAAFFTSRLITRPLRDLQRVAGAVSSGDLRARAQPASRDELGQVAGTMNQMLDEVTALVQTREERDQIQQQIVTLLSEVSTAAEGDLTVEAQVTEGALGSVADSFNYMVSELRTIIANVNEASVQVSSSSGEILAASTQLATSAHAQAEQISNTSRAVEDMSSSINHVSENARMSAHVASEARRNASQGLESVRATIGGMQRIRTQVQQTGKQIKRLGESSQEIGQIVQVIEEMADQTNLLALNAAIQAAMAGEHGRGFAVVAEEVRRLAERAANSTKQISLLVQSIQAETTQAVIAMENSTQEVVEGSRLADTAGQALESIDAVVSRMAELSEAISEAADQQAVVSRDIARSMAQISEATQSTTSGSRQTAESVGYLARLADQLKSSVAHFPPQQERGIGRSQDGFPAVLLFKVKK